MTDPDNLTDIDKLCVVLDLHPRLQERFQSLYSRPADEWDEEWVIRHLRAAFGSGLIARSDRELVDAIRDLGYGLTST